MYFPSTVKTFIRYFKKYIETVYSDLMHHFLRRFDLCGIINCSVIFFKKVKRETYIECLK